MNASLGKGKGTRTCFRKGKRGTGFRKGKGIRVLAKGKASVLRYGPRLYSVLSFRMKMGRFGRPCSPVVSRGFIRF